MRCEDLSLKSRSLALAMGSQGCGLRQPAGFVRAEMLKVRELAAVLQTIRRCEGTDQGATDAFPRFLDR